ncbi:MAG: hypothetical protein Q3965_01840 [Rothia sp. (in: high G+C Gram-positive bacteria)]|nr:hypothetical protein [Rothia sp. (in: high G+C Gram-positive bacteria)]
MKKFAAVTALAAVAASSALAVAPAHAEVENSSFASYTANGVTSQYHVISNNIDWSQPVGVVFYFDGDYSSVANSKVGDPGNPTLQAMGAEANARNLVFVSVISPDRSGVVTWHQDRDVNGDWFRSFATDFMAAHGIDNRNVWTMGHSGGSEFITFELNSDPNQAWRAGGGSIMLGGGGSAGISNEAALTLAEHPMYWYVGAQDDDAATPLDTGWSALVASGQGHALYQLAGFNRLNLTVVPNTDHHNYDFPGILGRSIDDANIQLSTYTAGKYVNENGAIAHRWQQLGGESTLGLPSTDEAAYGSGFAATFKKGETETLILWSEQTGAYTMNAKGSIYFEYLRGGADKTFGFPITDEYLGADGITRVYFSNGQVINWTEERGTWVSTF